MVAHTYNPSYLRSRDRRIEVRGQPEQKVSKTLSYLKEQANVVVCTLRLSQAKV
jgi:hypothetical protein